MDGSWHRSIIDEAISMCDFIEKGESKSVNDSDFGNHYITGVFKA